MEKYIIEMVEKKGITPYDIASGEFDTLEEANKYAEMQWDKLTKREQDKCTVKVYLVKKEWLEKDAINEDGEINWFAYYKCDSYDGYFDSEKLKKEED